MTERAADPTPDALAMARKIEPCVESRCYSWFDHDRPCSKCNMIARALDAFAQAAVEKERERCAKACSERGAWTKQSK